MERRDHTSESRWAIEDNHKEQTSFSLRRRFLSAPTLISFALALVILLFLATRFSVDLESTWRTIRNSDPVFYVLAFLVHYTTFFFRGTRWRMMLRNAGVEQEARLPSRFAAARLLLLGWFASSVTWFRLGDAYRAYAYCEESDAPLARSIGTVLGERVMDVILVFLILLTGFLFLLLDPQTRPSGVFLQIGFALVVASLILILAMQVLATRFPRLLPRAIRARYEAFHEGTMRSFRTFPLVMLVGLLGWFSEIGRLFFVVHATGLEVGIGLVMFVTVANAILSAVPLTPGGLGIVETGITGLLMLTLPRGEAASVALLDRSISYLSIVLVGMAVFAYHRHVVARKNRAATRA